MAAPSAQPADPVQHAEEKRPAGAPAKNELQARKRALMEELASSRSQELASSRSRDSPWYTRTLNDDMWITDHMVEQKAKKDEQVKEEVSEKSFLDLGFTSANQLHKKAAALRVKYRTDLRGSVGNDAIRERIHPLRVGVHPRNRDGSGLNDGRVEQLMADFVRFGFVQEEADHDAVAVLEEPRCQKILEWNQKMCFTNKKLAWVGDNPLAAGTIGHSHINQVLRHILLHSPTSNRALAGPDGKLNPRIVAEKDIDLYNAANNGLLFDTLSWKIEEEKDAIAIIQASLNRKNEAAMLEHEMQLAQRTLSAMNNMFSNRLDQCRDSKGNLICPFEPVKQEVGALNPDLVESSAFVGLFNMIAEWGYEDTKAKGAIPRVTKFLPNLVEFHDAFVNAKLRRLRLESMASICQLGWDKPYLKLAVLKAAYACDLAYVGPDGWIEWISSAKLKLTNSEETAKCAKRAEEALALFHLEYAACLRAKNFTTGVRQACDMVDLEIARAFMGKENDLTVEATAGRHYLGWASGMGTFPVPPGWFQDPDLKLADDDTSEVSSDDECSQPEMMIYKDGRPVKAPRLENVVKPKRKRSKYIEGWEDSVQACPDLMAKTEIFTLIWKAHRLHPVSSSDVLLVWDKKEKKYYALAGREMNPGELKMAPVIDKISNIVTKTVDKMKADKYLCSMRPEDFEYTSIGQDMLYIKPCMADKAGKRFLPPVWAVLQVTHDEHEANCARKPVDIHKLECTGERQAGCMRTSKVPMLVNTRSLAPEDKLYIYVSKPAKKQKAEDKKAATWAEKAVKQAKADETKRRSRGKAPQAKKRKSRE